jgi:hypothetical protein
VELRIVVVHHVEQGGEAAVVEEAAFLMRPLSGFEAAHDGPPFQR